jgi:predicted site-specific integrase-resolvase
MRKSQLTDEVKYRRPKDLAKDADVAYNSIIKWINQGRIKGIQFGTDWRIPSEEYERVLREGVK